MTTPEERADAVWRECFDGRRSTRAAVEIIAAAIREAENDKLEEALAKISGGFWTCKDSPFRHGASEAVWVGLKPDEMIEVVRSLIQKD